MTFLARLVDLMTRVGKIALGVQPLLAGQAKAQAAAGTVSTTTDTLVAVLKHVLAIGAYTKDTTLTPTEKITMIAPLIAKDVQLMDAFKGHKLQDPAKLLAAAQMLAQGATLVMDAYDDNGIGAKDLG